MGRVHHLLLALLMLACLGGGIPCAGIAQNADLMQQHAQRKRLARDMVLENLRARGLLPADGVVEFSARSVPDPTDPSRLQIQIDSLRILPLPGAPRPGPAAENGGRAQPFTAPMQPSALTRVIEYMELDIPVQQEPEVRWQHSFRIRSGAVQDDLPGIAPGAPAVPPSGAPKAPAVVEPPRDNPPAQDNAPAQEKAADGPWYKQIQ
ncbi:hypothetical protein [Megalodesulfovibrio gigas]|uniref:Uncharacterized protein n=1 Tax=Megalodesulfovibrio gigas (strain ATCC 19364 / DSM 1382 / NCIMB 9332 / VKM B-1759) TaxID=1121448 RepID=T2G6N9_MEGG1|nr:hypothetical protein [Megalodesulfovibrio gigas]AGW12245.1 hypothetical protein DGI_0318 [Megalodesulfovibrio gigas DSM 1382 = ATCC 19364]